MSRSAKAWLALGWVGFVLLPWHALGNWPEWFRQLLADGPRSAAALALTGAWWLAPIALPLLLAIVPLVRQPRGGNSRILIAAGSVGLAFVAVQGFAIGLNGWSWSFLGAMVAASGPS